MQSHYVIGKATHGNATDATNFHENFNKLSLHFNLVILLY